MTKYRLSWFRMSHWMSYRMSHYQVTNWMTTSSSFYQPPIWCIYSGLRATFNKQSSHSKLCSSTRHNLKLRSPAAVLNSSRPVTSVARLSFLPFDEKAFSFHLFWSNGSSCFLGPDSELWVLIGPHSSPVGQDTKSRRYVSDPRDTKLGLPS